jgi:hypothetical protein
MPSKGHIVIQKLLCVDAMRDWKQTPFSAERLPRNSDDPANAGLGLLCGYWR